MADAAHWILTQPSRRVTGRFFLDDEVLRNAGVKEFSIYRAPGVTEEELNEDFFL
jgi:citronellol/citronellal dehydrogenase